jgi:membrane-associated HD superfamily phosphohydrolase
MAVIESEQEQARKAIRNSKGTQKAKEEAIAAVNEYYAVLKDKSAAEEFEDNIKTAFDNVADVTSQLGGALSNLYQATADKRIAELDRQLQAELEAAGVAEETNIQKLQRELEEAKKTGDKETIKEKEDALKREQITQDFERKKAEIKYQADMASWRLTLLSTVAEAARAIVVAAASAPWPFNLPAIAFATGLGVLQVAIVSKSQPEKPAFASGGIVVGKSKQVDAIEARVTAGEMILNKEQQARLWALINGTAGLNDQQKRFMMIQIMQDGRKTAETVVEYINGGQVRLDI